MNKYIINTDGGSRGNPGKAACAFVVKDLENRIIFEGGQLLGIATNNFAEYQGVLHALNWVESNAKNSQIDFRLDSLLIVNQLKGVYKVKDPTLQTLNFQVRSKLSELKIFSSFNYVPREQNKEADLFLNKLLDAQVS